MSKLKKDHSQMTTLPPLTPPSHQNIPNQEVIGDSKRYKEVKGRRRKKKELGEKEEEGRDKRR